MYYEDSLEIEINIFKSEEKNLTCERLHKRIINKINSKLGLNLGNMTKVTQVILEASPTNVLLDYWLSLSKKSVSILQDGQTLMARAPVRKVYSAFENDENVMELNDFDLLANIGWGSFSYVYLGKNKLILDAQRYLARKKSSGKFYAIKQIKKGTMANRKMEKKLIYKERNNSILLRKAFMTKLHYTF